MDMDMNTDMNMDMDMDTDTDTGALMNMNIEDLKRIIVAHEKTIARQQKIITEQRDMLEMLLSSIERM